MGVEMGGENKKNGYGAGNAKMGMGMGMGTGSTRHIPVLSISVPYLPAPYETYTRLFKVLICYLYLNILLIALSYIIFNTSAEHFI